MCVVWIPSLVIVGLIQVTTSLQWPSSATIPDNVTVPACAGQDVTLAWDYSSTSEEHIVDVEWRYRADGASAEEILATEVNGHFFTEQSTDQNLEYIPGAGIRLLSVTAANSGTYSVHVNLNLHGSIVSHVQSVNVVVTTATITTDGSLQAHFQGARFLNSTQEHHLILICGTFNPLWMPMVDVVWTTPMNQTVASTFQDNDQFFLAVPNPFISGEYTCNIDNSSPATLCIPSNSPLRRGATVLVDGVEGRISLMGSEMQTMRSKETQMAGQIQTLQTEKSQMGGEIQSLRANNTEMEKAMQILEGRLGKLFQIRLVRGSNSHEGRVEIRVGTTWGTVCDDSWDTLDAEVVCRQLGYPRTNVTSWKQANFGQGDATLPILLDNVECVGKEENLLDCPAQPLGTSNCQHSEDAGVTCACEKF